MNWNDLNATEQTILRHLARGLRNHEIAKVTGMSHNTVRNTLARTYHKLGIKNRVEAVLFVLRENQDLVDELIGESV